LNSGGGGLAQSLAGFVGVVISFLFLSPIAFIFGVIYIFLFLAIHLIYAKKIAKVTDQRNKQLEKASGNLVEGLNNMLTIKSLGQKELFKPRFTVVKKLPRILR